MTDLKTQIVLRFGWRVRSDFDDDELELIIKAGERIAQFIDVEIPGYGGENWIIKNMGRAVLHKGGLPQWVVSKANHGANISLVFLNDHVWLYPNIFATGSGQQWLIHELAHVLDNSWRRYSVWFGNGPSDHLLEALGSKPSGLRWMNTDSVRKVVPQELLWHTKNNGKAPKYGDNSSADYFAETFTWAIFNAEKIPPPALAWLKGWLRLTVAY